ncbi:hypothetical protein DR980_09870 [Flavobacterium psychrolimnae]|uniref:Uncharacterized protein n=1 Tax=Flavobacterium psychrolimnae TaxID=249351 RepID=A0A366B1S1_9FLAO|nr:hypothetical protein DR980_09870 [Flavobacterium psychrolimnae]
MKKRRSSDKKISFNLLAARVRDCGGIPRFLAWIQPKARPQSWRYGNRKGNFLLWGYAKKRLLLWKLLF